MDTRDIPQPSHQPPDQSSCESSHQSSRESSHLSSHQSVPPSRQHRLNIRLTKAEWDRINRHANNSTCRSVSDYARKLILNKPVTVFYRNKSFDEFADQMTGVLRQFADFSEYFIQLLAFLPANQRPYITPPVTSLQQPTTLPDRLTFEDQAAQYFKTVESIRSCIEKLVDHETQDHQLPQHRQIDQVQ